MGQKKKQLLCENLSFASSEAYKRVRSNLLFSFGDSKNCHVIGITSANTNEGKSTTAANLAWSFASLGKRTLLIDGDMRKPTQHKNFACQQSPGLSNLLAGVDAENVKIQTVSFQEAGVSFSLIPAGDIPPNPAELYGSDRAGALLEHLRVCYDVILVDLPPVGSVSDAQIFAPLADGLAIVVHEGACDSSSLEDCVTQLRFTGTKILGFILNGSMEGHKGSYKKYGRYGQKYAYGYGYGYEVKNKK